MMFLAALAWAECDVAAAVETLKASGDRASYLCVTAAEAALAPLDAALEADPSNPRISRATALWLLERHDRAWDPALVARLPADDRRLLSDGVRARRGRKTPSPDHEKVFAQFDWYQPSPAYNDRKLTELDRANIALADKPPPVAAAVSTEPIEQAVPPARGCGCDGGAALLLLPLVPWRRNARVTRSL